MKVSAMISVKTILMIKPVMLDANGEKKEANHCSFW